MRQFIKPKFDQSEAFVFFLLVASMEYMKMHHRGPGPSCRQSALVLQPINVQNRRSVCKPLPDYNSIHSLKAVLKCLLIGEKVSNTLVKFIFSWKLLKLRGMTIVLKIAEWSFPFFCHCNNRAWVLVDGQLVFKAFSPKLLHLLILMLFY